MGSDVGLRCCCDLVGVDGDKRRRPSNDERRTGDADNDLFWASLEKSAYSSCEDEVLDDRTRDRCSDLGDRRFTTSWNEARFFSPRPELVAAVLPGETPGLLSGESVFCDSDAGWKAAEHEVPSEMLRMLPEVRGLATVPPAFCDRDRVCGESSKSPDEIVALVPDGLVKYISGDDADASTEPVDGRVLPSTGALVSDLLEDFLLSRLETGFSS